MRQGLVLAKMDDWLRLVKHSKGFTIQEFMFHNGTWENAYTFLYQQEALDIFLRMAKVPTHKADTLS